MIIKAGTYRWNDELTADWFEILLPFSSNGTTYFCLVGDAENNVLSYAEDADTWINAYSNGGWVDGYQIITVTADTEVDDDKGTWFTEHTQMLIKAGTYRFNDNISTTDYVEGELSFILPSVYVDGYEFTIEGEGILSAVESEGDISAIGVVFNVIQAHPLDNSLYHTSYPVYSSHDSVGWNLLSVYGTDTISAEYFPEGYGQIITITEDTYVPTGAGLWANENWKKQGEEEETYTIGAGIYKFKSTLTRPSTDFSQEMSFAVVGSEQINETARYGAMETGRDMYLDFINAGSDAGIAFYAFEETSSGNIGFLWDTQTIQVLEPIKASAVFKDWFKASTEKIVNADTLKAKIQSLIAKANSTTGKSDTDLTSGVNSLIEGYGQGDTPTFDGTIEIDGVPATDYIDYYEEGKTEGIAEGRQAQYDEFWDNYQENGKRTNYIRVFAGSAWNDKTFYPKYDIKPSWSIVGTFMHCGVTDLEARLKECGVVLDTSDNGNYGSLFENGSFTVLPEIVLSQYTSNTSGLCASCPQLHTIRKITLQEGFDAVLTDLFRSSPAIKNVVFEGVIPKNINIQWSTVLSKASISNIINSLSATATGQTATFSLTAVNTAFETSEGAKDGSTSDEWTALIATKSNWTISLV